MSDSERRVSVFSIGATPPSNPFYGEKWYNTTNLIEYVWTGNTWFEVAGQLLPAPPLGHSH